jgi:hypothetical protein
MVSQEIPKVLCKLAKSSDSATQRFASLALCNLCSGTREQKELVVKQGVLRVLLFLLRFPDLDVERCASLAIAALSLGSDRNKAEIIDIGFVRPLIETISYPDLRMRQCALLALNGIALGEIPETKERVFKDNGLPSLFDIIKTNDDACIHAGLYMLGTLGENVKIRDVLVKLDCLQTVLEKASVGSAIEIKRAAGKCRNSFDSKSDASLTALTTAWDYDYTSGYSGIGPDIIVAGYGNGSLRVSGVASGC